MIFFNKISLLNDSSGNNNTEERRIAMETIGRFAKTELPALLA